MRNYECSLGYSNYEYDRETVDSFTFIDKDNHYTIPLIWKSVVSIILGIMSRVLYLSYWKERKNYLLHYVGTFLPPRGDNCS